MRYITLKSSPAIENIFRNFVDSLANQLAQEVPNTAAENLEVNLVSIEQRFRATLRHRLAELGTKPELRPAAGNDAATLDWAIPEASSANDDETVDGATVDYTPNGWTGQSTQDLEATVDADDVDFRRHARAQSVPNGKIPPGYRMVRLLGKGGMGIVYKAIHLPLNRPVALKMILAGANASAEQIRRFQREAEAAAQLTHPNIVQVYSVDSHRGLPYFSLEYVDGSTLSTLIHEASLSDEQAAKLMMQVARAVHYLHEHEILHRDLKPQNILVTHDGIPKVADFGLAKLLSDGDEETKTGDVLGTPGYMAPEQARGEKSLGPTVDVFGLGAILYAVLTGRGPFVAPTPIETIRRLMYDDPLAPSKLQPTINRDLETICLKCLEKDPARRYQSALEVADELQRVIDGHTILARPATVGERVWKWCRRNPRVAVLSALASVLLVAIVSGGYVSAAVINTQKTKALEAQKNAEESEQLATQQAELALDTTRIVLYETQKFFKARPQLNPLRQTMLDGILKEIDRVYAVNADHEVKEAFQASALRQLGQIYYEAGVYETALEHFLRADEIGTRLASEGRLQQPELSLEKLNKWLGDTLTQLGRYDEAEARYEQMIAYRKKYFAKHPEIAPAEVELSLAEGQGRLGSLYSKQGQLDKALPLLQLALDVSNNAYLADPTTLTKGDELSGSYTDLSNLYEATGQIAEMTAASDAALVLLRRSAAGKSDVPAMHNLAKGQRLVGKHRWWSGNMADSEQHLREAVKLYEQVLSMDPDLANAQAQGADAYYLLARLQINQEEDFAATAKRGIEILEPLLKKSTKFEYRFLKLKLIAVEGRIDEALAAADALAGDRKSANNCLCAAIAYGLSALHFREQPDRKQELLNEGLDLIQTAVKDLGFDQFGVLKTDRDFDMFQNMPEFQELLTSHAK